MRHFDRKKFDIFPDIDLSDLALRQMKITDSDDYLEYMASPLLQEFLSSENIINSPSDATRELSYWINLFNSKRSFYWGIYLKESEKLIGTAGFNNIHFSNLRGDISYDLNPAFWGKSYMYRSLGAILDYGFNDLGLIRIQAQVMQNNTRSTKLLERCGFEFEGSLRNYEIVSGRPCDYSMFSKIQ